MSRGGAGGPGRAGGPDTVERIDPALVRTAFVLVLGTFMATLDSTIVAVGLDTVAARLGASIPEVAWVSTAYLLAVVTAVPASGWLVDRFGGRRTWITAVVVFVVASLLCATATSLGLLVAFRVLQGLAGGLLPPTGQTLLARAAGPGRIGRILGVVGVVPLLSPVLGPLVGGALLGVADWPWLFYVNLPIGLIAVVAALRVVPADRPAAHGAPFDVRGALLLSPGLALLVLGLTEFQRQGPGAALAWATVLLGAASLAGFAVHGLRHPTPLVDPRLFLRPPFGAAALALVVLGASVFGALFLLPLYLQDARGLSAFDAALILGPQGVGALVGSILVSRMVDRVPPRTLVTTGVVAIAVGSAILTQVASAPPDALLVGSLAVRGLGISMIGAPVMAIVYGNLDRAAVPRASSALNLLNTVGGSIGTAVLAVILAARLAARGPDVAAAYGDTFWWVLGFCLLAALGVVRLPGTTRTAVSPPGPSTRGTDDGPRPTR